MLFHLCVCTPAQVCVGWVWSECVHERGHVDAGQHLHCFLRWALSLNVEHADLVRQVASKTQEYLCICLLSVNVISMPATYSKFLMGVEDLNSGLSACIASLLLMESFPQFLNLFFDSRCTLIDCWVVSLKLHSLQFLIPFLCTERMSYDLANVTYQVY